MITLQRNFPPTTMVTSFLTSLKRSFKQLAGQKETRSESRCSPDESFSERLNPTEIAKLNMDVLLRLCERETEISLREESRNRCDDL